MFCFCVNRFLRAVFCSHIFTRFRRRDSVRQLLAFQAMDNLTEAADVAVSFTGGTQRIRRRGQGRATHTPPLSCTRLLMRRVPSNVSPTRPSFYTQV